MNSYKLSCSLYPVTTNVPEISKIFSLAHILKGLFALTQIFKKNEKIWTE